MKKSTITAIGVLVAGTIGTLSVAATVIEEKVMSNKNIKDTNTATLMLREIRDNIDNIDPTKLSDVDQEIYREIKSSIQSAIFWSHKDERFLRLVSMSRDLKASATK